MFSQRHQIAFNHPSAILGTDLDRGAISDHDALLSTATTVGPGHQRFRSLPEYGAPGDSVDPNFDAHETSEVFKCGLSGKTALISGIFDWPNRLPRLPKSENWIY